MEEWRPGQLGLVPSGLWETCSNLLKNFLEMDISQRLGLLSDVYMIPWYCELLNPESTVTGIENLLSASGAGFKNRILRACVWYDVCGGECACVCVCSVCVVYTCVWCAIYVCDVVCGVCICARMCTCVLCVYVYCGAFCVYNVCMCCGMYECDMVGYVCMCERQCAYTCIYTHMCLSSAGVQTMRVYIYKHTHCTRQQCL